MIGKIEMAATFAIIRNAEGKNVVGVLPIDGDYEEMFEKICRILIRDNGQVYAMKKGDWEQWPK